MLLDGGFFPAMCKCLAKYGQHDFEVVPEHVVEGGTSKVDYGVLVKNDLTALLEAKSPSFMKEVVARLPQRGIEMKWVRSQSFVPKLLSEVSALMIYCPVQCLF